MPIAQQPATPADPDDGPPLADSGTLVADGVIPAPPDPSPDPPPDLYTGADDTETADTESS